MTRGRVRAAIAIIASAVFLVGALVLLDGSGAATNASGAGQRVILNPKDHITLSAYDQLVKQADSSAKALAATPGMPACAPPALPSATYPPHGAYGIPFLAALTNGRILTGYDEWAANHHVWKVGKKTYDLYPWESKVYDITGWVTGLLQLPSLTAVIPPRDLVFCDTGGTACESASPPNGECIRILLATAPTSGSAPSPPITNDPPTGRECFGAIDCLPYTVSLAPIGDSVLTVAGVASDGALELTVRTSAITTVGIHLPTVSESCPNDVTTMTLSSQQRTLSPDGPIAPNPGNPDDRGMQTSLTPVVGPLGSATTSLGSNDFTVPAFSTVNCPIVASVFDGPLGGWNTLSSSAPATENNNYFDKTPLPAIAGLLGWVQFSATTTISDIGLPVGPPSSFSLNP
jgi:hypothetical protein